MRLIRATRFRKAGSCFNSRTLGRVRQPEPFTARRPIPCFNSRTLGRVRHPFPVACLRHVHVSIHAPWEGCDVFRAHYVIAPIVSIHAPWEGCDQARSSSLCRHSRFNSRTLGRVRLEEESYAQHLSQFQFTHPGKGATHSCTSYISRGITFQFTHPGKGATPLQRDDRIPLHVSIHAPWEGCDDVADIEVDVYVDVSIHAPWEGCDPSARDALMESLPFQFTHPGKGATDLAPDI